MRTANRTLQISAPSEDPPAGGAALPSDPLRRLAETVPLDTPQRALVDGALRHLAQAMYCSGEDQSAIVWRELPTARRSSGDAGGTAAPGVAEGGADTACSANCGGQMAYARLPFRRAGFSSPAWGLTCGPRSAEWRERIKYKSFEVMRCRHSGPAMQYVLRSSMLNWVLQFWKLIFFKGRQRKRRGEMEVFTHAYLSQPFSAWKCAVYGSKDRPVVGGNWKCNPEKAADLDGLIANIQACDTSKCDVYVCPSPLHVSYCVGKFTNGAEVTPQNCNFKGCGAFTGEMAVEQMKDMGISQVLIGHSERRGEIFPMDDNTTLATKLKYILDAGMSCVFCIGEPKDIREKGLDAVLEET
ncbi:unnamed protein product [Prorocentrum cordatum]|uniref:Triosephosphate isomerase n=1 Tax=Prorocentrum cordatum TaxID=2364126 RepID=A0ABN9UEG0_9DINO|nr:unnamed protein product [Polarella glacialis]